MPKIILNNSERLLITGKTGSGKTFLAKYITRNLKRLVVLDGKGTLTDWKLEPYNNDTKKRLMSGDDVRIRVLPPVSSDILAFWDDVLINCYQAGRVVIYIDELYSVVPPNKRASDILWSMYTRGRELGVGVWASTQRPVWIPLFALSESEHFFCFRLQLFDDRKRMSEFMGNDVMSPIADKHGFFYSRASDDTPIYVERLQVEEEKTIKTKNVKPAVEPEQVQRREKKIRIF